MIASQLNCPNDARLAQLRALANPAHNAIDYLEVLPGQRLLAVHCVAELGPLTDPSTPALSADNVVIGGGVRISAIKVVGAWRGDQVPSSVLTEPLGPDPTQILLVQTDSSGDFSTYRLMIVDSASDPELAPRAEFDPLLAAVDFSFKVDCPSDFDCAKTPACPPAAPLPPVDIDYLSKDYQSFYQLLINRLATTMPQWQERNGADVGVTLVELFSYVGDQLSYYQDAVATEAYLGTARQRISVRRHARLLDYLMHDGVNARAFVCLLPTPVADGATVPAGTAISERDAQLGPGDHPLEQAAALGAVVFQTMHDVVVHESQNEIEFYTWGDPACCLPVGATTATLVGTAAELGLQCGDALIFQERLGPESGLPGDARIVQRCAVRLIADPVDESDPLPQLLGQSGAPLGGERHLARRRRAAVRALPARVRRHDRQLRAWERSPRRSRPIGAGPADRGHVTVRADARPPRRHPSGAVRRRPRPGAVGRRAAAPVGERHARDRRPDRAARDHRGRRGTDLDAGPRSARERPVRRPVRRRGRRQRLRDAALRGRHARAHPPRG